MNWLLLSAETPGVIRDENGVPIEWTLLKIGENNFCQNGKDGVIYLSAEGAGNIIQYHNKKGELIPVDSEHYLFELAEKHKLDETDVIKLFPGQTAALGYGSLHLSGEELRIRVKWTDSAYPFIKDKIYKYFSPVLRGMETGPLRLTSVAMTNTPAINQLDALAASALSDRSDGSDMSDRTTNRKEPGMGKVEKAICRLLGRDVIALSGEGKEEEKEKIALEVEEKASTLEQILKLLNLEAGATPEEILAALKAETEKAKSAEDKQKELEKIQAEQEEKKHAELVEKGKAERKIVESDMDYVNSLDSKALSAYLDHAAPKVPAPIAKPERKPDAVALSATDRIAIDSLKNAGVKNAEELYLKHKRKGC